MDGNLLIRSTSSRINLSAFGIYAVGVRKADLIKFRELLISDAEFQEKFRKAAEAYNGGQRTFRE